MKIMSMVSPACDHHHKEISHYSTKLAFRRRERVSMWKRTKDDNPKPEYPAFPKSYSQPESRARKWASRTVKQMTERATIGPSVSIKGEISGEGNVVIQGRVEGKVNIKKGQVTVAKNGLIKADIHGKVISVEGEVEGNLVGEEQVVVRESGVVSGDMKAPRINLQDGAKFRGHVDTDCEGGEKQLASQEVPLAQARNSSNKV
jgi:cytoskeletal protein CcmA (bactofilin family)